MYGFRAWEEAKGLKLSKEELKKLVENKELSTSYKEFKTYLGRKILQPTCQIKIEGDYPFQLLYYQNASILTLKLIPPVIVENPIETLKKALDGYFSNGNHENEIIDALLCYLQQVPQVVIRKIEEYYKQKKDEILKMKEVLIDAYSNIGHTDVWVELGWGDGYITEITRVNGQLTIKYREERYEGFGNSPEVTFQDEVTVEDNYPDKIYVDYQEHKSIQPVDVVESSSGREYYIYLPEDIANEEIQDKLITLENKRKWYLEQIKTPTLGGNLPKTEENLKEFTSELPRPHGRSF